MLIYNWFWTVAIFLLINPYQRIIRPANAGGQFEFDPLQPPYYEAVDEQTHNDALALHDFVTQTLELPHTAVYESPVTSETAALGIPGPAKPALCDPYGSQFKLPAQLTDPQRPLPPLQAGLGNLRPTKPASRDRYGTQLELPTQSSTSHSLPTILLESINHNRISETYIKAAASKRLQTQEPLAHDPPSSLNYIPSSHELPINEYSQPSEGPSIGSADTNYRMNQISESDRPMAFSNDGQRIQSNAAWPSPNHQSESHQTVTHQQTNLKQNRNYDVGSSRLEIPEPRKRNRHYITSDSIYNRDVGNQEWIKKATSASQKITFQYRWVNFQPSKIHGQLVIQLIEKYRFGDNTGFSELLPDSIHAKQLDETIQNQLPKKMICLESSASNIQTSMKFLISRACSSSTESDSNARKELIRISRQVSLDMYGYPSLNFIPGKTIDAYQMTVLSEFGDQIKQCKQDVAEILKNKGVGKEKLEIFDQSMKHFPIYLFYVDLINALLPAHGINIEDEWLKTQRKNAADCFLGFNEELITVASKGDKIKNQSDRRSILRTTLIRDLSSPSLGTQDHFFPFVWKAIEYWIITSRVDLAQIEAFSRGSFKKFFNSLVWSLVAK